MVHWAERRHVDGWGRGGYNSPMRDECLERATFLRSLPLFQDLGERALRRLVAESRRCLFRPGDLIFHQGEPGSTCHIIARGRVRVFVLGTDGRELSVRILGPGEIIGEMALFDDQPRSASVEALEETRTLQLHRDILIRCLKEQPALALGLLRALSARLRHVTTEAEELASLPVADRLMRRLERLAEWAGTPVPGGVRITLPMTQEELATLVGTSRESVNRALVRLRHQGKVHLQNGWIVLSDEPNAPL